MSIKTVLDKVNTKKMKIFLLFLLCSFLAWTISKLSDNYESRTNFVVAYENIPDSLLSRDEVEKSISAKIRASGFQFLGYTLSPKKIKLNVGNVLEQDNTYFLTASTVRAQIENQLSNRISLIEIDVPVYYTDLYKIDSKMIVVKPIINLELAKNHLLEGELRLEPDSVKIKGPKNDIAHIQSISTVPLLLEDISASFSKKLDLQSLDSLSHIVVDARETTISGKVVRFSEREFDVNIDAKNVPEGYRLRMFPDHVELICKAEIERLKNLEASDFKVIVDYNSILEAKYLFVELEKEPEQVFSVRLLQNRIEFVLEKI